jgi:cation diffusion facilitator CzcD-associated flavoprotein CzcO
LVARKYRRVVVATGEESFDIPHGPEQPGLAELPQSA